MHNYLLHFKALCGAVSEVAESDTTEELNNNKYLIWSVE